MNAAYKELWTARETLRPYWELKDKVDAQWKGAAKAQAEIDSPSTPRWKVLMLREQYGPLLSDYREALKDAQLTMRLKNKPVEKALIEWEYTKVPVLEKLNQ